MTNIEHSMHHVVYIKDKTIVDINVFASLDTNLFDQFKEIHNADSYLVYEDGTWHNLGVGWKDFGDGVYKSSEYPPQEHASFIWDAELPGWKAPKPMPTDGKFYGWNEDVKDWVEGYSFVSEIIPNYKLKSENQS